MRENLSNIQFIELFVLPMRCIYLEQTEMIGLKEIITYFSNRCCCCMLRGTSFKYFMKVI